MTHRNMQSAMLFSLACALMALTGCADVDLNNIDPSAKVDMGLSLPVGEINLKIGDFLGDTTVSQITLDEDGTYRYTGKFSFENEFLAVDLSDYEGNAEADLKMTNYLPAGQIGGIVPVSKTIDIPVRFAFDGLNTDLDNQRVDSVTITAASLSITLTQNFGIDIDQISNLSIELPDHIRRANGQTVEMLLSGAQFGKAIKTELGACTIILMDDPNAAPSNTNLADSMDLTLHIGLEVSAGQTLTIDDQSKLHFRIKASVEDYSAIYGYFGESNSYSADSTLVMSEMWKGYEAFRQLQASLAEPTISINLNSNLGVPQKLVINHLYTQNADKSKTQKVTFNGSDSYTEHLPNYAKVNDPLDKTASNTVVFNKDNSTIGSLFAIRPEYINYAFGLSADSRDGVLQHRITKNTTVDGNVEISVPFKFNEGTTLEYADTINADLSAADLDSLLAEVDQVDSISIRNLRLVLTAKSYIPWDVTASFVFLDENYKDLKIEATDGNKLTISGPTDYKEDGSVNEPGKSYVTIAADDETVKKLKQVRYILLDATIKDVDASALKNKNAVFPVSLNEKTNLQIKVAVSANVSAYLKLIFDNDK